MIKLQDFLYDINFYCQNFSEPPEILVEGTSPKAIVWLRDNAHPIVKIELNIEMREIKIPSIIKRTASRMHHRIVTYGQESRTMEDLSSGIAEIAIQRWLHYKYWSVVNG